MNIFELVPEIITRGVAFKVKGPANVSVCPADRCTETEIDFLRVHKLELIDLIRQYEQPWSDIEERAAMIGAGSSSGWCMAGAYEHCLGDVEQVVARWRHLFSRCEPQSSFGELLRDGSEFLLAETHWPEMAANLGWSERELWGISPTAEHMSTRAQTGYDGVDCHGLFTAMALSSFHLEIENLTPHMATLVSGQSGSQLTHPRRRWWTASIPSWESKALRNPNKRKAMA
jgi:hypothetical protein